MNYAVAAYRQFGWLWPRSRLFRNPRLRLNSPTVSPVSLSPVPLTASPSSRRPQPRHSEAPWRNLLFPSKGKRCTKGKRSRIGAPRGSGDFRNQTTVHRPRCLASLAGFCSPTGGGHRTRDEQEKDAPLRRSAGVISRRRHLHEASCPISPPIDKNDFVEDL